MATESEAAALGFALPQGTDSIRDGDDAIRQNATAAVDLYVSLNAKYPAAVDAADRAEAAAELAEAISGLTGEDDAVALLVNTPTSDTAGALSATYATRQADATQETATLGPELVTSTGWTLGAGWTGDFATGFTHASGGGTAPLTWTPPFATGTKSYMVQFTIDSATNSSNFTVTLGGSFGMVMYEGAVGGTWTYKRGIASVVDGSLAFTPETVFDGRIYNVSVKEVAATFDAPFSLEDSTGVNTIEMRPGPASLGNIFIGEESGRFNVSGHGNAVIGADAMRVSTSGFWNAAVGYKALESNVNGTRNAALGVYALQFNVTGHRNIAIGPFALRDNTHGKGNIGLGADVAWKNQTGDYNIALGQAALGESVSGDCNVAIGRAALAFVDGVSDNIAIGDYALCYFEGGSQPNVAIGQDALRNTTTGVSNTAIGNHSLVGNTTGVDNVGVGNETLAASTTVSGQTAVGSWSGRNLTGERNTALGAYALQGGTGSTGIRNTAFGHSTGTAITSGSRNLFMGASVGVSVTSGSDNILLGYNVQNLSATTNNHLNIGNALYGDLSAKRIGVATVTTPTARMHLPAGVATASGAPMKINAGALMTTPEAGAIEFDGTDLYITTSTGTRKKVTAA